MELNVTKADFYSLYDAFRCKDAYEKSVKAHRSLSFFSRLFNPLPADPLPSYDVAQLGHLVEEAFTAAFPEFSKSKILPEKFPNGYGAEAHLVCEPGKPLYLVTITSDASLRGVNAHQESYRFRPDTGFIPDMEPDFPLYKMADAYKELVGKRLKTKDGDAFFDNFYISVDRFRFDTDIVERMSSPKAGPRLFVPRNERWRMEEAAESVIYHQEKRFAFNERLHGIIASVAASSAVSSTKQYLENVRKLQELKAKACLLPGSSFGTEHAELIARARGIHIANEYAEEDPTRLLGSRSAALVDHRSKALLEKSLRDGTWNILSVADAKIVYQSFAESAIRDGWPTKEIEAFVASDLTLLNQGEHLGIHIPSFMADLMVDKTRRRIAKDVLVDVRKEAAVVAKESLRNHLQLYADEKGIDVNFCGIEVHPQSSQAAGRTAKVDVAVKKPLTKKAVEKKPLKKSSGVKL